MTFWQKMFSFEGRIGRQDFWICTLILWGVQFTALIALMMAVFATIGLSGLVEEGKELSDEESLQLVMRMIVPISLWFLLQLVLIWPNLAVKVKRFHDRDQPGALAALFFLNAIPLLNYLTAIPLFVFWLVNLGMLEGTLGPNRYGQSPNPELTADTVFA